MKTADVAHYSLIAFTDREPKDFMVPSRWGAVRLPVYITNLTIFD